MNLSEQLYRKLEEASNEWAESVHSSQVKAVLAKQTAILLEREKNKGAWRYISPMLQGE